ncbi:hypothetical protein HAX54_041563 [Datura stramonium]|uniref:Uncharacterized protein n=1 Tax=Datura stramonium TaxID=4076 RepID=A0ABS8SL94_DATST|nr:hypothetical protein [Datura stramonium]
MASPKSPSSDSLKTLSDGSVSVSQGHGMPSASHRDNSRRDGGQCGEFGLQSDCANSNRRGNCCPQPCGDRDQDWKPHKNWGNMPPQRVPARPWMNMDGFKSSTVVEVQGKKLRQKNDWFRWLLPPSIQNSNMSSPSIHFTCRKSGKCCI